MLATDYDAPLNVQEKGQQAPTVLHLPASVQKRLLDGRADANGLRLGQEAIDLAAHAGLHLDPWQKRLLRGMCATRRGETFWNPYTGRFEYKWAAFEAGIMASRQNGKNSILEARELAGLFLFGEREIIHSAHQMDTSLKAFERILLLIENTPDLANEVARIPRSHGMEGIILKTGQQLEFRTRTKGGGKGFTGDLLILDEAMILPKIAVRALMPTLSARPNPQIIYTGSAGNKDSHQFGAVHKRGLAGTDPRLLYAAWFADLCTPFCPPDCEQHDRPDDPRTWAKTNPGLGYRITLDYIEGEWNSMGLIDPEGFAEQRLGVGTWPTESAGWAVIDRDSWESRHRPHSQLPGKIALAAATAPDKSMSCIAAAGAGGDGDTHVEITGRDTAFDYRPGIQWVVPRIVEIWRAQEPEFVVIDPASPAGTLTGPLEAAGVNVITPSAREVAQACGDFKSGLMPRKGETATIVHLDQAPLNTAVANADTRDVNIAGLWAWSAKASSADISPLAAATLAVWGYKKHLHQKPSPDPWMAVR